MESPGDSLLDYSRRLRAVNEEHEREDRARAAALTVSERLALATELSMFAVRMREAFAEQSRESAVEWRSRAAQQSRSGGLDDGV